jgi:uncharacterized protein YdbL (DUF1318 family)
MKRHYFGALTTVLMLAVASCLIPTRASAAGETQRMVKRAPAVRELKDSAHVGESHEGLLAIKTSTPDAEKTVKAENADRTAVYKAIAVKQGVDWKVVGARRFVQLQEQAHKGDWILDAKGKWQQKQK